MKIIISLLPLLLSLTTLQAQSLSETLKVIKNGTRFDRTISLDTKNQTENLPISIIKGIKNGPVFTIIAGIHGYEYPPIIAVQELMQEIDPTKINGTVIILPIANKASFYGRSPFINPIDGKNLNNSFPGSAQGTITNRIADWITREVIPLSDVFLDIHGGDASEDLIPFVCYYDNKDENTERARLLSEASGMTNIVSYPYNITKTEPAKYAFKQAVQNGKTALSIEAGKLGNVQHENVKLIKDAVYNMLAHTKIYPSTIQKNTKDKNYFKNQTYIKAPSTGIFYSKIKSGDYISKDQMVGFLTDEFGNIIQNIKSSTNGTVLYKIGTPPVNTGETLFCIGS
ncbi:succinylglutamate desuccinylase [Chryseobacterium sp. CH21]|uniref:M14 family metallopeptidase n=1 Tax=Chryseobacterium sp. CH21 TaxID=713556 RepID=UPI00100AB9D9|nr:M14 family metallopeptidase [Chryseobacterium sp. CH21]RXM39416.1 succinylglutamate desuccinylase [Chryseobacterium sp. CH21]